MKTRILKESGGRRLNVNEYRGETYKGDGHPKSGFVCCYNFNRFGGIQKTFEVLDYHRGIISKLSQDDYPTALSLRLYLGFGPWHSQDITKVLLPQVKEITMPTRSLSSDWIKVFCTSLEEEAQRRERAAAKAAVDERNADNEIKITQLKEEIARLHATNTALNAKIANMISVLHK